MFVNAHVFINFLLFINSGGGEGGGSWNISSRVPPPPPASPQVQRYGIYVYGSQDVVRNCNCTVWSFVY